MKRNGWELSLVGVVGLVFGSACGDPSASEDDEHEHEAEATSSVTVPLPSPIAAAEAVGTLPGSFAVSADGAASYSIPIEVPPGRAGLQPDLALEYSSRAGNGIAGAGWSLSGVSQIGPCDRTLSRDGVASRPKLDANDRYCLDGAKLVAINGTYGASGTEYRTEPDSFARILSYRDAGDTIVGPPTRWVVYTKSGRIIDYGLGVDERLEATEKVLTSDTTTAPVPRRFGWQISRVSDRIGNVMTYTWSRTLWDQTGVEPVLRSISYGGSTTTGLAANRTVSFSYESRPDPSTRYFHGLDIHSSNRLTSITTTAPSPTEQTLGFVRQYKLTYSLGPTTGHSRLATVSACDTFGGCLPATTMTYANTPVATIANEKTFPITPRTNSGIRFFGSADVNGDGFDDLVYRVAPPSDPPSNPFADKIAVRLGSPSGFGSELVSSNPLSAADQSLSLYDIDGDGRVDLVAESPITICDGPPPRGCSETHVEYKTNAYSWDDAHWTFGPALTTTRFDTIGTTAPTSPFPTGPRFGDTNGDMRGDLVRDITQGPHHALRVDTSGVSVWGVDLADIQNPRLVDLDGDGLTDFLVASGGTSAAVYFHAISVRGGGSQPGVETALTRFTIPPLGDGTPAHINCEIFADVNGDGLADWIDLFGGATVHLNLGNGDFSTGTPTPGFTGLTNESGTQDCSVRDAGVRVVDYNRDGRQDLLVLGTSRERQDVATLLLSTGEGFVAQVTTIPITGDPNLLGDAWAQLTLDVNGDGLFDVVEFDIAHSSMTLYTQDPNNAAQSDLLVRVNDGMGALVRQVDYTSLVRADYKSLTSVPSNERSYIGPMLVVSNESLPDPMGGAGTPSPENVAMLAFKHSYADARVDTTGEGWLGFRTHTIEDVRGGLDVPHPFHTITYDQTPVTISGSGVRYPFRGMVVDDVTSIDVSTTKVATRTTTTFANHLNPINGVPVYFGAPDTITTRTYDASSFDRKLPPTDPGTPLPLAVTTTTQLTYDRFGNELHRKTDRGAGVSTTTTRTFNIDEGNWLLGRVGLESTASQTPNGSATRSTGFTYVPGLPIVVDTFRDPNTATARCTHVDTRDAYTNPTRIWTSPGGTWSSTSLTGTCGSTSTTRATTMAYDTTDSMFVKSTTNAMSLTAGQTVHPGTGVTYRTTDPNGQITSMTFDVFGRLRNTVRPDGSSESIRRASAVANGMLTTTTRGDGGWTSSSTDRVGLEWRRSAPNFENTKTVIVDSTYDHFGRPVDVTRPYFTTTSSSAFAARYTYDTAGRVTKTCRGDTVAPACKKTVYTGLTTDVEDEDHAHTTTTASVFGPVASTSIFVAAGTSAVTRYVYGAFDTLVRVIDAAGFTVAQTFDPRGRRTDLVDGDVGHTATEYNAFDEVTAETDARGIRTTIDHDAIGRVTKRTAPDGIDQYAYDTATSGKGLLASKTNANATTAYTYNKAGRATLEHWTIDGAVHDFNISYDAMGRPDVLTYPAVTGSAQPFAIKNTYNAIGNLVQVSDVGANHPIWTAQAAAADGQIAQVLLGNGLVTTNTFDVVGRLATTDTAGIRYTPHHVAYTYSAGGDVTKRTFRIAGAPYAINDKSETFLYDTAHRLISSQVTGQSLLAYSYDILGNTTQASDWIPNCAFQYAAGASGPHRMTSATCNGTSHPLTYDASGNTTSYFDGNANATITYTSFGKARELTNISGGMRHSYDADHNLVKRERYTTLVNPPPYSSYSGVWGTTLSMGPFEIRSGPEQPTTDFVHTITVGGKTIAQRYWRWNGSTGSVEWRYLHSDALGTPERITDSTTNAVELVAHGPWGLATDYTYGGLIPSLPKTTRLGFSGHDEDAELALVDMGGRHYLPAFHRFLQPDSVVQAPTYGPSWNRYSYAFNNPMRYSDPTGHEAQDPDAAAWAALEAGDTITGFLRNTLPRGTSVTLNSKGEVVVAGAAALYFQMMATLGNDEVWQLQTSSGALDWSSPGPVAWNKDQPQGCAGSTCGIAPGSADSVNGASFSISDDGAHYFVQDGDGYRETTSSMFRNMYMRNDELARMSPATQALMRSQIEGATTIVNFAGGWGLAGGSLALGAAAAGPAFELAWTARTTQLLTTSGELSLYTGGARAAADAVRLGYTTIREIGYGWTPFKQVAFNMGLYLARQLPNIHNPYNLTYGKYLSSEIESSFGSLTAILRPLLMGNW